jgi:hypothetical protein
MPAVPSLLRGPRGEIGYMAFSVFVEDNGTLCPVLMIPPLHRSLVVDGAPVAMGIQPIGDALCHTNPTFAYGASLSISHGFTLARVTSRADNPREIALGFDEAVGADAAARFDSVTAEARDRLRLWQGEPIDIRDPADSMALFLRMSAYPAAIKDANLFRAVARARQPARSARCPREG